MIAELNLSQIQKCVAEFKRRKVEMRGKKSGLNFSSNALQFFLDGAQFGFSLIHQSTDPNEKKIVSNQTI